MNSSRDGDSHLDDERAAFEAWVSGRTVVKKYGAKLNTRADGSYGDYRINDRWLAWKARAAMASAPVKSWSVEEQPDRTVTAVDPADIASAPVSGEAQPVAWENFPAYLIDHCEGDTITEEGIQRALSRMLLDQKYAAPQASPAADGRDAKDADPLQAAANWLVNGAGVSVYALASNLMIGHNRADRLYDAAIAAQQGEGEKE